MVDRGRIAGLRERERRLDAQPRSQEVSGAGPRHGPGGVPMTWTATAPGGSRPAFVDAHLAVLAGAVAALPG